MGNRYEAYCLADPDFYDSLTGPRGDGLGFPVARRALPPGWRRRENDDWISCGPPDCMLPAQGWKIHDLRWQAGPLYVRYGGSAPRYCLSPRGEPLAAIEDPEGGLVPDRRDPVFSPPEWAPLPEFLSRALAARNSTTIGELPYRIEQALHFSNGGGLYQAEDTRDGAKVVLKEARPHAGLASDGADAVARLHRERDMLERLAGIEGVPEVRGHFTLGEHEFLVLEYIDGNPLTRSHVQRYPLTDPSATKRDFADYTRWALDIHRRVSEILAEIHERDVVYGDLHLHNIVVCADGRVALVDFEVAAGVEENHSPTLTNPGFAAPSDRTGFDIDRYCLGCLGLALFLPMTTVIRFDCHKARQLADTITEHFTIPRQFLQEAVRAIEPPDDSGLPPRPRPVPLSAHSEGWRQARASLTAGVVASATPDREDRLFPGDIDQFTTGGLNIAHGAAGVLYALSVTDCGRYPSFEEWLALRVRRPDPGTRLGFYNGLHGVAYVLDHLDHREQALEVLDRCMREQWHRLEPELFGGLSGIGLNLAHFASRTDDATLLTEALHAGDQVADALGATEHVPAPRVGTKSEAGLMHGSSGPALLFLRLYEHTGDTGLLDCAANALRQDLRHCILRDDGSMHVDEGWRSLPYLDGGSAGIGLVLDEYLVHQHDDQFAEASRAIQKSARSPFCIQSGLFNGRAGTIVYLSHRYSPGKAAQNPLVAGHIRRLNWHALSYQGHLAFPGDQLLRLSMDLATGAAGILLALGSAMHDKPVGLPLLPPARAERNEAGRSRDFPVSPEGGEIV